MGWVHRLWAIGRMLALGLVESSIVLRLSNPLLGLSNRGGSIRRYFLGTNLGHALDWCRSDRGGGIFLVEDLTQWM